MSDHDREAREAVGLSKDDVFGILSNSRRRMTLQYLKDHEGEAGLSDLAEHVVKEENDLEEGMWTSKQRKRVYVSLYQSHLPKMEEVGIISYDERKRVKRLEAARVLDPFLETAVASTAVDAADEDLTSASALPPVRDLAPEDASDRAIRDALVRLVTAHPDEFTALVAETRQRSVQSAEK